MSSACAQLTTQQREQRQKLRALPPLCCRSALPPPARPQEYHSHARATHRRRNASVNAVTCLLRDDLPFLAKRAVGARTLLQLLSVRFACRLTSPEIRAQGGA